MANRLIPAFLLGIAYAIVQGLVGTFGNIIYVIVGIGVVIIAIVLAISSKS